MRYGTKEQLAKTPYCAVVGNFVGLALPFLQPLLRGHPQPGMPCPCPFTIWQVNPIPAAIVWWSASLTATAQFCHDAKQENRLRRVFGLGRLFGFHMGTWRKHDTSKLLVYVEKSMCFFVYLQHPLVCRKSNSKRRIDLTLVVREIFPPLDSVFTTEGPKAGGNPLQCIRSGTKRVLERSRFTGSERSSAQSSALCYLSLRIRIVSPKVSGWEPYNPMTWWWDWNPKIRFDPGGVWILRVLYIWDEILYPDIWGLNFISHEIPME